MSWPRLKLKDLAYIATIIVALAAVAGLLYELRSAASTASGASDAFVRVGQSWEYIQSGNAALVRISDEYRELCTQCLTRAMEE